MNTTGGSPRQLRGSRRWALALACVACAGCATHSHTLIGEPRTPLAPASVKIYLEPLDRPYVEIAMVEATSRLSGSIGADAKTDAVIRRLQREAASLGANGILLQDMTGGAAGIGAAGIGAAAGSEVTRDHASFGLSLSGAGDAKRGRGTAIYVAPP